MARSRRTQGNRDPQTFSLNLLINIYDELDSIKELIQTLPALSRASQIVRNDNHLETDLMVDPIGERISALTHSKRPVRAGVECPSVDEVAEVPQVVIQVVAWRLDRVCRLLSEEVKSARDGKN